MPKSSEQTPDEQLRRLLFGGPRARRAAALLAALAVSGGIAACGGGDDADGGGSGGSDSAESEPLDTDAYLEQVNGAQTDFATEAAKLNLANPASAKAFGNSLGELNGLIETLRKRLAAIEPPEDVASEHDALVRELGDYGDVIVAEQDALTSGDPEKARAAALKVGEASTEFSQQFDATIKQINDNLGLETSTDSGQ
jgi:hypothetical protein